MCLRISFTFFLKSSVKVADINIEKPDFIFNLCETDFSDGRHFEVILSPGNNFISTKLSLPPNFSFTTSPNESKIRRISLAWQPVLAFMAFAISF